MARLLPLLAFAWLLYWWMRRLREAPGGRRERPPAAAASDPWGLLGVAPGSSPEEITRAYHEQMKRYHPDRVADLGEDLRRLAHEKTIAIQRAYAEILRDE